MYQETYKSNAKFLERFEANVAIIEHYGGEIGAEPLMIKKAMTAL